MSNWALRRVVVLELPRNPFSLGFMLVSIFLLAALAVPQPLLQDSSREPLAPFTGTAWESLSPALQNAIWDVLSVEDEINTLTRPLDGDGQELVGEALQAHLFGEGSPLFTYLETRLPRFAYGKASPHINECIDSVRHDAGFAAMENLLAEEPTFDAASLLGLVTQEFIEGEPLWGSEAAIAFHKEGLMAGQLAPLGNGGALGYLTWGMLYSEGYWKSEEHDREAFISELLSLGFDSVQQGRVVTRALETPMLFGVEPGRGIAGDVPSLVGKVGFTAVHEKQLQGDLEVLHLLEESPATKLDPEMDVRRHRIEPREAGIFEVIQPQKGHLKSWLPRMLFQVREELYPGGASYRMRRGTSLEERETYWKRLFESVGYVAARELALEELAALASGDDSFVDASSIELLLAKQSSSALLPEEAVQLAELQAKRIRMRESMTRNLVRLSVNQGLEHFYELATMTLANDIPEALAGLGEVEVEANVSYGWILVSLKNDPRSMNTIEAGFAGELNLGESGLATLVNQLSRSDHQGRNVVLEKALTREDPTSVFAALIESEWLPKDRYQEEMEKQLGRLDDPQLDRYTAVRSRTSFMQSLVFRKDKEQAKALVLQTMSLGHWSSPDSQENWGMSQAAYAPRLLALFTAAEKKKLVKEGKLHPSLLL
jgi:hypothetical protein